MTPREGEGLSKKQNGERERNKGAVGNILGNCAVVRSLCWQDTAAQRHLVVSLAEQGLERASLQQAKGTSS